MGDDTKVANVLHLCIVNVLSTNSVFKIFANIVFFKDFTFEIYSMLMCEFLLIIVPMLFFGTGFVEKKIRKRCQKRYSFIYKNDTSQHQAAFFHKFGLVRLSLNPGVLTPGFLFYRYFD